MAFQKKNFRSFLFLLFLCWAGSLQAQSRPRFPVPRAEFEFNALVASSRNDWISLDGDVTAFKQLAVPYAPFDLQVENGSAEEANKLRNFYFGVLSSFAQLPREKALQLTNEFHCGPACILARRDVLKGRINLIKNIVTKFGRLQDVRVLAQWGTPDEVRVNNVFHWHGETKESIPSREMGLVPSGEWKVLGSLALYYKEHNINPAELNSILQSMQELGLAALVKTNAGQIEAIQTGISDNESGLLFLPPEASKPKVHEHVPNGREYVYLEELEPGVFYYETT